MRLTPSTLFLTVAFIGSVCAQTPTPVVVLKRVEDAVTYAPKPEYPLAARSHHIQGKGIFLLHLRRDGTVESVDAFKSTGHTELDEAAMIALRKWRFHPGPTKVKIPLEFRMHGAQE